MPSQSQSPLSNRSLSEDQKIHLLADATARAAAYLAEDSDTAIFPTEESIESLNQFDETLPEKASDACHVLAQLDALGAPATVRTNRGRYFGFVNGGSEPVATAASVLATVWDQNMAQQIMSPVGAHLDKIASRWVTELLGLPPDSTACFCAGATIANITCVIAARDALLARVGWDTRLNGLNGSPPIKVVASEEAHVSVTKALRVAGIGTNAITFVETDAKGRMRAQSLPPLDEMTLVILQAGNVNTGHSDPFSEVIPLAHASGAWVHVDGAFGLWAAATSNQRVHVAGVHQADSWATDAHKWLNTPYDSGIAICARSMDLARAMSVDAAYLQSPVEPTGRPAPMQLGLQMSQRARAIDVWAVVATLGRSGIESMIDKHCNLAIHMSKRLQSGGAKLLAPVGLNQMLFSFGSDELTTKVIAAVQKDRTCWVGGTVWKNTVAMRISLSDSAMTKRGIDESADAILRCWKELPSV